MLKDTYSHTMLVQAHTVVIKLYKKNITESHTCNRWRMEGFEGSTTGAWVRASLYRQKAVSCITPHSTFWGTGQISQWGSNRQSWEQIPESSLTGQDMHTCPSWLLLQNGMDDL